MYQVLARTWRPQTFADLVGQQHVARTLTNAIEADRLAHAYVFAGLRGTGKTTVARILAKCLNCEKGPTTQPCGRCDACVEIAGSRAIDVLEIDAASRTKVEQTRELLETVTYAPARDRFKVLIIDEAHMLSKASFNALLKTLEEPPPNVLFVLATTEMHKVLPTILSRCQVFEFRRVAAVAVATHLRRIADTEKITVSDAALDRIARAGEGSVRDSLSVLERVLAFCGTEVSDDEVLRVVGAVGLQVLVEFIEGLAARDPAKMLGVLDGLVDEGHDLLHFWGELIAALRDLMLLASLPECGELLARAPEEAAALQVAAGELSPEDLSRAFQILADLEPGLKASSRPRFLFEATLIRLGALGAVRPIEEFLQALDRGDVAAPVGPPAPSRPTPAARGGKAAGNVPAAPPKDAAQAPRSKKKAAELPAAAASDLARKLIDALQAARPLVGALLAQATAIRVEGTRLVVVLPESSLALRRQLERPDTAALIREHAATITGRELTLDVEATAPNPTPTETPAEARTATPASKPRPERAAAAPSPTPSTTPRAEPAAEPGGKPRRAQRPRIAGADRALIDVARRDPGVRQLIDSFGAQVVDIRPLEPPQPEPSDADATDEENG